MKSIPPHIFWPGMIIALLMFSVGWGIATIVAAQSDGGAQIIGKNSRELNTLQDEYEQKKQNAQLGWQVDIEFGEELGEKMRIRADIRNRDNEPVEDLEGKINLRRPHLSGLLARNELRETEVPGRYITELPVKDRGLWDLTLIASNREGRFVKTYRRELEQ